MRGVVTAMAILLVASSSAAFAQGADVGLVNLVSGDVTYVPSIGAPGKAQAFMKVRDGDRFNVNAGAQLRVVYFDGGRQENWAGPSSFRAKSGASQPLSGAAAGVTILPVNVSQRIARVPELMQNARLGGIQVRGGILRKPPFGPEEQESLREARATYEQMRKSAPADDITPEFYMYSVLNEYQMYDEMQTVVAAMRQKRPDDADIKTLETYVQSRAKK